MTDPVSSGPAVFLVRRPYVLEVEDVSFSDLDANPVSCGGRPFDRHQHDIAQAGAFGDSFAADRLSCCDTPGPVPLEAL